MMFKVGDIIKPLPSSNVVYGITTYKYVKKLKVTALADNGDFSAVILEFTPIGLNIGYGIGEEFDGLSPMYFELCSRVKLLSVKRTR